MTLYRFDDIHDIFYIVRNNQLYLLDEHDEILITSDKELIDAHIDNGWLIPCSEKEIETILLKIL